MGMFAYRTPGVRFEWLDTSPQGIEPVRTDIAGFAGFAERGPLHRAVKVQSWTEYTSTFGGLIPQSYLAYAVYGFFQNGGLTCYVVRVADPARATPAAVDICDDARTAPVLRLAAASPGAWGRGITVTVQRQAADRFALVVQLSGGNQERFRDLSLRANLDPRTGSQGNAVPPVLRGTIGRAASGPDGPNRGPGSSVTADGRPSLTFVEATVNDSASGSRLIYARVLNYAGGSLPRPGVYRLKGGSDGLASLCPEHWCGSGFVPAPCAAVIPTVPSAGALAPPSGASAGPGPQEVKATVTGGTVAPTAPAAGVAPAVQAEAPGTQAGAATGPGGCIHCPPAEGDGDGGQYGGNGGQNGGSRDPCSDAGQGPDETPLPILPCPPVWTGPGNDDPCARSDQQRTDDMKQPWGLAVFEPIAEISILAAPDLAQHPIGLVERPGCFGSVQAGVDQGHDDPRPLEEPDIRRVQDAMIEQCERLKDRMALLDMPRPDMNRAEALAWRRNSIYSSYAALYYPWLRVPLDPACSVALWSVPPSGHVAGVYARVDSQVGPQKPPANEVLENAQDVTIAVTDNQYGDLNWENVNVLKVFPGRGLRIGGARTLSIDGSWAFVNVRRLLLMIEASIIIQTQWLVFEPNNQELWQKVDRIVRSFLDAQWRTGALDGASADDAYSVRCDDVTNPQSEIDQGRMLCLIGVRPPWPAEFVVVRIGRTESGMQVVQG